VAAEELDQEASVKKKGPERASSSPRRRPSALVAAEELDQEASVKKKGPERASSSPRRRPSALVAAEGLATQEKRPVRDFSPMPGDKRGEEERDKEGRSTGKVQGGSQQDAKGESGGVDEATDTLRPVPPSSKPPMSPAIGHLLNSRRGSPDAPSHKSPMRKRISPMHSASSSPSLQGTPNVVPMQPKRQSTDPSPSLSGAPVPSPLLPAECSGKIHSPVPSPMLPEGGDDAMPAPPRMLSTGNRPARDQGHIRVFGSVQGFKPKSDSVSEIAIADDADKSILVRLSQSSPKPAPPSGELGSGSKTSPLKRRSTASASPEFVEDARADPKQVPQPTSSAPTRSASGGTEDFEKAASDPTDAPGLPIGLDPSSFSSTLEPSCANKVSSFRRRASLQGPGVSAALQAREVVPTIARIGSWLEDVKVKPGEAVAFEEAEERQVPEPGDSGGASGGIPRKVPDIKYRYSKQRASSSKFNLSSMLGWN